MKKRFIFITSLVILLFTTISFSYSQELENYQESCTSILVSKGASSDGSVMTAHSCDANYRTWLTIEGRKRFAKGERDYIRHGYMHNEFPSDTTGVKIKGSIDAPKNETFSFLNVAYPCLNEKQLAIGETTTTGKRELYNKDGLFCIEELERIALQRCSTARDAIHLMGSLAEEYGYGDWGECLTIADKKEAWHFEIYGSGKSGKKPGAIWVAQRVPDGQVGVSANVAKIGIVDFKDKDNFMYAKDIKERCKELGLWDGKSPFKFYPMVNNYPKNFMWREYIILSTLAPSLGLKYTDQEMPFSVTPENKITPEQMFAFYRETYEGGEFDPIKNLKIGVKKRVTVNGKTETIVDSISPVSPFMSNEMRTLLNSLKPDVAPRIRTIAVIQCSYSHIIRLRDWLPDEIGGVAYFSFDNPAQSPRIPIYAGQTELPEGFDICGQKRYRKDAAIWSFRETNRIATMRWDKTKDKMNEKIKEFENQMMEQTPELEKQAKELLNEGKINEAILLLNKYCKELFNSEVKTWEELKADFLTMFARSL